MKRPIAAIDIGTNSFHMIVARSDEFGSIEVLDREKVSVRLGSGGDDFDQIQSDAQDRAIHALRGFAEIARGHNALIHAVGTSAVREARNQKEFLKRVQRECGIQIHVIPGQEEARLIYLGVLQSLPLFEKQLLTIDIGGGSTEYLIGKAGQPQFIQSLKLGSIRMTERFCQGGVIEPKSIQPCRTFVRSRIESMLLAMKEKDTTLSFDSAVGSAGTIKTILELVNHEFSESNRLPGMFTKDELDKIVEKLLSIKTPAERIRKLGLDDKRADIIVGGAIILQESFQSLGITEMIYSPYALREGVLFEILFRKKKKDNLNAIRLNSVKFLARKFLGSRNSDDTARLSLMILTALHQSGLAHLTDEDLLEYGAILHNIGISIGHAGHHKHAMYIIQNTDTLLGFSNRDIAVIAAIARYHRKGYPKEEHIEFQSLSTEDQKRLTLFAGILRIAIGLSRAKPLSIQNISAAIIDDKNLKIEIKHDKSKLRSAPDLSYALSSADLRKGLLETALKRSIQIDVVA